MTTNPAAAAVENADSQILLGTAPDSWGVWFDRDPHQVEWKQYLDEAAAAGYVWTELGPYGFLPTDPAQLSDELGQRGLRLSGGAVFAGLHNGAEALQKGLEECREECRLLTALGAKYLVLLPPQYTDMHTGASTEPGRLEPEQWDSLTTGMDALGKALQEEFGVELVFHPHVDSHVDTQARTERLLENTDPRYVNLCLDTGHLAYCGGDNVEVIRKYPERVTYTHLKQVDPLVVLRVRAENRPFSDAVKLGAMVEPPHGIPEYPPLVDAMKGLHREIFAIVEQDLYPCAPEVPLPIAERTARYLGGCGLGPVRRRG
ncbi:MAG: sugar phosphate isomerase/epimerase [Actinomycetota bacterium]|nr:sugar phosphate isomerase/epimerase [Actinomycetota bacterium]